MLQRLFDFVGKCKAELLCTCSAIQIDRNKMCIFSKCVRLKFRPLKFEKRLDYVRFKPHWFLVRSSSSGIFTQQAHTSENKQNQDFQMSLSTSVIDVIETWQMPLSDTNQYKIAG